MATAYEKRIIVLAERLADSNHGKVASPADDVVELLCEMEEAVKAYRKHKAVPVLFVDHLRRMLADHDREHPTTNSSIAYGCTLLAIEHLNRYPLLVGGNARAIDLLHAALKAFSEN